MSTEQTREPGELPDFPDRPGDGPESDLETEFTRLKSLIEECGKPEHLDERLAEWLEPNDKNIPYKFLTWPIRRIVNTPFQIFSASWSTDDRLRQFIDLLRRVSHTASSSSGFSDEKATLGIQYPSDSEPISRQLMVSGTAWRTWCEIIERHDLGSATLGVLAPSLHLLPGSFWNQPLREFTSKTYRELSETRGLGTRKINVIVDLFRDLASQLTTVPARSSLGITLLPKQICKLSSWLLEVLEDGRIPTLDEIATSFCRPLLTQLQTDLAPEVAAIVVRRLGFDGKPETLNDIAIDVGLTRERVRQLTQRATNVLHVRWPQGKHLLDDLYELLCSSPDAQNQVVLVRTILDRCFDVDFAVGGSRDEVIAAFHDAARKQQTPMTEEEVMAWAATRFRRISPEKVFGWISEEAMTWSNSVGRVHYFSDDPRDILLSTLLSQNTSMSLAEASQLLETDERSVANRLSRDPRIIEIDDRQLQAAQSCGLICVHGQWRIDLVSRTANSLPGVVSISVESLSELIVAGLLQAKIADATVWGVHRYANQILESVYNRFLPVEITPIILQEILSTHSNGLIRRMRRRRLRWDADHTIPARGKIGWISYVSRSVGIPMTVDEMHEQLTSFYQDYEPYILRQLNLDDEDGDESLGVSLFEGVPHRVPPLIVPNDWKLDCNAENVSDQIKQIVSKIVDLGRLKGLPKSEFSELPWLIEFTDYCALGKMNWLDNEDLNRNRSSPPMTSMEDMSKKHVDEVSTDASNLDRDTDAENTSHHSNLDSIVKELDGLL